MVNNPPVYLYKRACATQALTRSMHRVYIPRVPGSHQRSLLFPRRFLYKKSGLSGLCSLKRTRPFAFCARVRAACCNRYIDLIGVDKDILYDAVRVYYALRKLVIDKGFNAISFECFPFIVKYRLTPCLAVAMMNNDGIPTACENDFYSLAILAVSFALTGKPGWIANPSGFTSEGYVRLAHCTIAPLLGGDCYLVPHFETGNPYAVTCRLSHDKVVLLRLSLDYRRINAYKAKVVESGLLEPGYCRTQAILDLGPMNGIRFLETAAGNHHVVIPWNPGLIESLKTMAWWLGWDLKIYN